MKQLITDLKKVVSNNEKGHLPLNNRVKLAKEINNPELINKIYLECVKLIYVKYNIEDHTISNLIEQAEGFLYSGQSHNFESIYNQYKNYAEGISDQPYAGVAATMLALCSSIAYDAEGILNIEDYEGEDDDVYDWEMWNPDFFASNSFSEESPIKRREFWVWFLNITNKLCDSPNILPSPKIKVERISSPLIKKTKNHNTDSINSILKKVVALILEDAKDKNWEKIEIEGQNQRAGLGMKGIYVDENGSSHKLDLTYYLYDGDQCSVELMQKIKDEIYEQSKEEGTWFSYNLLISSEVDFQIKYNYDQASIYKDKEPDLEDFVEEFEEYPRLKKFTPLWWQELIEKNSIGYLDSREIEI